MKTRASLVLPGAVLLLLISLPVVAQEIIGMVKRSSGSVVIERSSQQIAASAGINLHKGDRLITGADGYANIGMQRAPQLNIGPHTVVAIDRYAAEDKPSSKFQVPAILQSLVSFFALNRQR